jgi:hypothetical protein
MCFNFNDFNNFKWSYNMEKRKSPHPQWALNCKLPGTEIRNFGGKYYLYKVWSEYNPETKKSKKKTGNFWAKLPKKMVL